MQYTIAAKPARSADRNCFNCGRALRSDPACINCTDEHDAWEAMHTPEAVALIRAEAGAGK